MKIINNILGLLILILPLYFGITTYSPIFIIIVEIVSIGIWYLLFYLIFPLILSIKGGDFSFTMRIFHYILLVVNLLGVFFTVLLIMGFKPNSPNYIGIPSLYLYYLINAILFRKETLWKEDE